MLWSVAPPDAVQAEAAPHQVHSASYAPPAAPGGTAGPSGDHGEEEDSFVTSTPVQPPNQVSIYFINFILFF